MKQWGSYLATKPYRSSLDSSSRPAKYRSQAPAAKTSAAATSSRPAFDVPRFTSLTLPEVSFCTYATRNDSAKSSSDSLVMLRGPSRPILRRARMFCGGRRPLSDPGLDLAGSLNNINQLAKPEAVTDHAKRHPPSLQHHFP